MKRILVGKVISDKYKYMVHPSRKDARRGKTNQRRMLKFKFYCVKVSNAIRIAGKEELVLNAKG